MPYTICPVSAQIRREADDYDKRQAELERENILKARAKTLAGVMIDNQDDCEITGVTMDDVVGNMSDEKLNEYTKLSFACAAGSGAAVNLLRHLLHDEAERLIRAELEKIECSHDQAAGRIVQRRAAKFWGERA